MSSNERTIAIKDVIEATLIGSDGYFKYNQRTSPKHDLAIFSPNKERFLIVTQKGRVATNTNEYFLLLFDTGAVTASAAVPPALLVLSSSSNRPAINEVQWLTNDRIVFLGERPGESHQLYMLDIASARLTQLTHHATNLVSYAISENLDRWFFAEKPPKSLVDSTASRRGIVVKNQLLPDLITLEDRAGADFGFTLFVQREGSGEETEVRTRGFTAYSDLFLSPDGQYLVLKTLLDGVPPKSWSKYRKLAKLLDGPRSGQTANLTAGRVAINQFELLNTKTRQSAPLLDTPIDMLGDSYTGVAWAPSSESVVVTGVYLPLDGGSEAERAEHASRRYAVEVKVPSRKAVPISAQEIKVIKWDRLSGKVLFEIRPEGYATVRDDQASILGFRKDERGDWRPAVADVRELSENRLVQVSLAEDMNAPPRVVVTTRTGEESLLLDLNPGFRQIGFARVEEINFKLPNGRRQKAGLYLPNGYVPDRRYPLVIQTHGWNPGRFRMDGPFTTAFAAQPLAAAGIAVVQLPEELTDLGTPREVRGMAAAFEAVIDYLDARGIVDPRRVGVIGFSRTGLGVEYALTHSRRRFAAATLADCNDAGYFLYLSILNFIGYVAADYEGLNGGVPFGKGLRSWEQNSPGFSLEKVQSPVRLETNAPASLFTVWEWFVGLSRLGKPVDLIYMPAAAHVLVKPWDRVVSQQGNVDWFRFWLQGYEDPDPAKVEQYQRWERLCEMQVATSPGYRTYCVATMAKAQGDTQRNQGFEAVPNLSK
jgi:dipeptidyl aminopeptidase/acylaminoacyl peptidase